MRDPLRRKGEPARIVQALASLHDGLTQCTFGVAVAATAYLTLVLAFEVVARYVLHRPTGWAPDTSALAFAAITFLAAPKLAWKGGHADMNLVVKALPVAASTWLRRVTLLVAVLVCGVAAWFGGLELLRLYKRGVTMIAVTPIPKWWLMAAIVYSVASMGIYFLRHFFASWAVQDGTAMTQSENT